MQSAEEHDLPLLYFLIAACSRKVAFASAPGAASASKSAASVGGRHFPIFIRRSADEVFGHEHLIVLPQVSEVVFPPSQSRVKLAARSKFSKKVKEPRAILANSC